MRFQFSPVSRPSRESSFQARLGWDWGGGKGEAENGWRKGGREESVLTDESEAARGKDGLRFSPPQSNLAVFPLPTSPQQNADPSP